MIIGFFADQCGPCRCIPGFERAALSHAEIEFGRVDTRVELALAERFQLTANPTVLVVRDGAIVARHGGPLSDQGLEQLIAAAGSGSELPVPEATPPVHPYGTVAPARTQPAGTRRPNPSVAPAGGTQPTAPAAPARTPPARTTPARTAPASAAPAPAAVPSGGVVSRPTQT